jgi:hypothetical protein
MRVEGAAIRTVTEESATRTGMAGLRTVAALPAARLILGLFGAQTLVRGFLTVLMVVVALDLLDLGQSWVGFLAAAPGGGALLGALGARRLAGRPLATPFLIGLAAWGVPLAVLGAIPGAIVALCGLAVLGVGDAVLDVSGYTLLQRVVPDDLLARTFGVHNAITLATVGVGSIAAPALIDAVGIPTTLILIGLLTPLLAVLSASRIRSVDHDSLPVGDRLALVQGVPMFAALSVAAAEQIATRLAVLDVLAGTDVIGKGEVGDRFYILDAGEFALERDGREIVVQERGDFFGEIALLRDVPRTTTVSARVDSRVYALERSDFLAAVTGHRAGAAAAQAIVEERMPGEEPPR